MKPCMGALALEALPGGVALFLHSAERCKEVGGCSALLLLCFLVFLLRHQLYLDCKGASTLAVARLALHL